MDGLIFGILRYLLSLQIARFLRTGTLVKMTYYISKGRLKPINFLAFSEGNSTSRMYCLVNLM